MAVIDKLVRASYRGIEFFYKSSSETGGFKVAEHLYPGSDNFKVEQLGKVPRRFDIEARVKFENRDSFDNALDTSGSGLLSHPMYGNIIVKVTQYTKTDTIDDLGLYNYSIQFVFEFGLILPTLEGIGLSMINQAKAAVLDNVVSYVNTNFSL